MHPSMPTSTRSAGGHGHGGDRDDVDEKMTLVIIWHWLFVDDDYDDMMLMKQQGC